MIVCNGRQKVLLITQADHARLASEMLSLFRLPELLAHPRRALLLQAVREHDNGWWEEDAAPRRSADGSGALDFRSLPDASRRQVWRRSCDRLAVQEPYVAALIAGHLLRLATAAGEDEGWEEFRGGLVRDRDIWLEAAGVSRAEIEADDRWIAIGDGLSLAACTGESALFRVPGWAVDVVSGSFEAGIALAVEPFPLAGATRFEVPCRELPPARYASDAELGLALATARWQRVAVRLAPGATLPAA